MGLDTRLSRKDLLTGMICAAVATAIPASARSERSHIDPDAITLDDLKAFEKIAGVALTDAERKEVLDSVRGYRKNFEVIRSQPITYLVEPPVIQTPLGGGSIPGSKVSARPVRRALPDMAKLKDEDIAFLSASTLGGLIKAGKLSPVRLTEIYLDRLKRFGDKLLCVVTPMEDMARKQAAQAEKEIASGHYRGPLHGIPYGIKDLFATKRAPTTWGAEPYEHQTFDYDATVVQKLEAAGAILLAKLSMGALAMDNHWFRGGTKNPWNPKEGSSGSSAGSAAATAAGLVGFSIGTETLGSIASPSTRCRVTGFRPTYGRVSRFGGMALAYSHDKVGPICREVEDCALVFAAICGHDPNDASSVSRPFNWRPNIDPKKLKIGVVLPEKATTIPDEPIYTELKKLGATLVPIKFTPPADGLDMILEVESASAFDAFTRGKEISELKNSFWPQIFRAARHVPAVEYIQAQRARTLLMHSFEKEFGDLDCFIEDDIAPTTLLSTNLCGHPQVILPNGSTAKNESKSKSLIGRLYQDDKLLAIAEMVQQMGSFHKLRPDLSRL